MNHNISFVVGYANKNEKKEKETGPNIYLYLLKDLNDSLVMNEQQVNHIYSLLSCVQSDVLTNSDI
jgi:hypothetical protein